MSMTWVPVQGNDSIAAIVPFVFTWIGLIQRRPNSPAKNCPS